MPRSERPVIRVVSPESRDAGPVDRRLEEGRIRQSIAAEPETATVLARPPAERQAPSGACTEHPAPSTEHPTFLGARYFAARAERSRGSGNGASGPAAGAGASKFSSTLRRMELPAQTTEFVVEQSGDSRRDGAPQWATARSAGRHRCSYLPPDVAATTLRVRASASRRDEHGRQRRRRRCSGRSAGPVRVLVVEAAVTWPAVFVRRALEGEPAFAGVLAAARCEGGGHSGGRTRPRH